MAGAAQCDMRGKRSPSAGRRACDRAAILAEQPGPDAARLLGLVCEHWGIENRCHWVMDVVFAGDQSQIRSGHAAKNMSLLRRLTHNLLLTSLELCGKSVRSKRLAAVFNPKRLAAFLGLCQVRLLCHYSLVTLAI